MTKPLKSYRVRVGEFLAFSCRQRCCCPSCDQKRALLLGKRLAEEVFAPAMGIDHAEAVAHSLLVRTPANWRQSIYYHYYEYPGWHMVKKHYGVRTRRWKLIHFYGGVDAWELCDLQEDPHEMNNSYNDPASAAIIAELKQELLWLREHYGEPLPVGFLHPGGG